MSTTALSFSAQQIDQSISGGYGFFIEPNGYTGDIKLNGAANLKGINSEYIGVNGVLAVTGSQVTYGNITGHSYNSLARISCTGDAFVASLTGTTTANDLRVNRAYLTGITDLTQVRGGLRVSGDFNNSGSANISQNLLVNGNINNSGTTRIAGSLFVKGVEITGNAQINQNVNISGDIGTLLSARGSLLVGTGQSGVAEFGTGTHGHFLKVDTGSSIGLSYSAINVETGVFDGYYHEKELGADNSDLSLGDEVRFFLASRAGKIKRIEADVGEQGTRVVEIELLSNGSVIDTLQVSNEVIYSGTTYAYISKNTDLSVSTTNYISVRISDNGGDLAFSEEPAKGKLRVGIYFKPN